MKCFQSRTVFGSYIPLNHWMSRISRNLKVDTALRRCSIIQGYTWQTHQYQSKANLFTSWQCSQAIYGLGLHFQGCKSLVQSVTHPDESKMELVSVIQLIKLAADLYYLQLLPDSHCGWDPGWRICPKKQHGARFHTRARHCLMINWMQQYPRQLGGKSRFLPQDKRLLKFRRPQPQYANPNRYRESRPARDFLHLWKNP